MQGKGPTRRKRRTKPWPTGSETLKRGAQEAQRTTTGFRTNTLLRVLPPSGYRPVDGRQPIVLNGIINLSLGDSHNLTHHFLQKNACFSSGRFFGFSAFHRSGLGTSIS